MLEAKYIRNDHGTLCYIEHFGSLEIISLEVSEKSRGHFHGAKLICDMMWQAPRHIKTIWGISHEENDVADFTESIGSKRVELPGFYKSGGQINYRQFRRVWLKGDPHNANDQWLCEALNQRGCPTSFEPVEFDVFLVTRWLSDDDLQEWFKENTSVGKEGAPAVFCWSFDRETQNGNKIWCSESQTLFVETFSQVSSRWAIGVHDFICAHS